MIDAMYVDWYFWFFVFIGLIDIYLIFTESILPRLSQVKEDSDK